MLIASFQLITTDFSNVYAFTINGPDTFLNISGVWMLMTDKHVNHSRRSDWHIMTTDNHKQLELLVVGVQWSAFSCAAGYTNKTFLR